MNKILITGYRHSGTTMLMQLLRSHPQVGWIEMEESYIEFDKPREWIIMMAKKRVANLKEKAWGEKIPWGNRNTDKAAKRAISFSKKWLKFFKHDGRIIHIIRHPYDAASSGFPDGIIPDKILNQIIKTVPQYIDYINNKSQIATIVYEDLLINPKKHLHNIFKFCGLSSSEKIIDKVINLKSLEFGKINADRAFAYKKKGVKSSIDYSKLIGRARFLL